MMSDREIETVKRAKQRIHDLLFDHTVDLADSIALAKAKGWDPEITAKIEAELSEVREKMDSSGLGIFEQLEVWMDLIDKKGI